MKAFNEIRAEKGLDPIDFNEDSNKLLQACTDRLLESFKVSTADQLLDYQDEFKGGILKDIGVNDHENLI